MALPTIQDLENLFPQLTNQARGLSNKSQSGKKFTERELADAISSLLTKTKSVSSSKVKQTAIAAGDSELLEQTEALESLIQGGVLDRMEEFLKGNLKAGQTDDLIDQFNALNDVITSVTNQSPIAISRMIRSQVSTLRSNKTSSTRKATAVQNFQKVSGQTLTEKDIEELIGSIEDGTENLEDLASRMEMVADSNDRMVAADSNLTMSLQDLINGVESGLIETDSLTASISDLVPLIEESSLAGTELVNKLENDPSLEVLKELLEAVEGQDIGNIDKENRKGLNLGEDSNFSDKISNLTPDIVKTTAETSKGFIFDLIKGGVILALLGSTGILTTIGKILLEVGRIGLNFIKETVAPKIVEILGGALDTLRGKANQLGGFGGTQREEVGNIVDFFVDSLSTKLTIVAERISLAFRKIVSNIPGFGSDLPLRSATLDAQAEALETGQYVVFRDEDGIDHLIDFEGVIKLRDISSEKGNELINRTGAIDRRIPKEVGDFGGSFLGEVEQRRITERQSQLRLQVRSQSPDIPNVNVSGGDTINQASELAKKAGGVNNGRVGGGGSGITQGGGGKSRGRTITSGRNASQKRIQPSVSPLGRETQLLNVNPGAQ